MSVELDFDLDFDCYWISAKMNGRAKLSLFRSPYNWNMPLAASRGVLRTGDTNWDIFGARTKSTGIHMKNCCSTDQILWSDLHRLILFKPAHFAKYGNISL